MLDGRTGITAGVTDTAHGHVPVLLDAVLGLLDPQAGQTCVDGTLGRGGHAAAIIPRLGPGGTYLGLDMDPGNADYARQRLAPIAAEAGVTLNIHHRNFVALRSLLDRPVDLVLADLGFASTQMDDATRGLTFSAEDAPLDMRLDPTLPTTAADLVNTLPPNELANLLYELGEERLSRRIARKIAEARENRPIQKAGELARLVRRAYGPQAGASRIDPATRTFMALRIAVNAELEALDRLLEDLPSVLKPGGRVAIISFHSLEDRRVKQALQRWDRSGVMRPLTRKPVVAEEAEVAANPRSRSAKLRAGERMAS